MHGDSVRRTMKEFAELSTPVVADACVRCGLALRAAPPRVRPLAPGMRVAGRALPARHYGSVDVFLEAFGGAQSGDVLVVDNAGREDEACVGDLTILEADAAGIAGIVVWGLHRDTPELVELGVPVFSCGRSPLGPTRLDAQEPEALVAAHVGEHAITADDVVFADDDGVIFVAAGDVDEVLAVALAIRRVEREQAGRIRAGETLREQTAFDEYLAARVRDPSYSFRSHLRRVGGAIEE